MDDMQEDSESENEESKSEECEKSDEQNPYLLSDEDSQNSDSESQLQILPTQTHTVTFKCIGSVHNQTRQEVLCDISRELRCGRVVEVRVHPASPRPRR